jgi:lysophospholipase L1-like esterase
VILPHAKRVDLIFNREFVQLNYPTVTFPHLPDNMTTIVNGVPVGAIKSMTYSKIVLFGDSITELSCNQDMYALTPALQSLYIRKFDVINRGYGGYNSEHARYMIEPLLESLANVELLVVFFGSNDAVNPQDRQYVGIDRYTENLRYIAETAVSKGVKRVILVGPSLFDEENAPPDHSRSNEKFRQYTKAALRVANDLNIGHLDLGKAFLEWIDKTGRPAKDLLPDNLHYSGEGYKIFFDSLVDVISSKYPEIAADNLDRHLPGWDDIDNDDIPGSLFGDK